MVNLKQQKKHDRECNGTNNLLNLKHPIGHMVEGGRVRHIIYTENTLFKCSTACDLTIVSYDAIEHAQFRPWWNRHSQTADYLCPTQIRSGNSLKPFLPSWIPDLVGTMKFPYNGDGVIVGSWNHVPYLESDFLAIYLNKFILVVDDHLRRWKKGYWWHEHNLFSHCITMCDLIAKQVIPIHGNESSNRGDECLGEGSLRIPEH